MQLEAIWQHDHHYWGTFSRITPRNGYAIYTCQVATIPIMPGSCAWRRMMSMPSSPM